MVHMDRELKYRARIPIPDGYSLVGVADVHKELEEGEVYSKSITCLITFKLGEASTVSEITLTFLVCTHKKDEEAKYYPSKPGYVYVTRSPSIHPGDVQRFWARHPSADSIYAKHPMVNCIVFSCKGAII